MKTKIMRAGLLSSVVIWCFGCTSVSRVMGVERASIAVTYYAPAWGPNEKGEEIVYFLKKVTMESGSDELHRIYFCSVRPDGTGRKEIAWLWKDQPDQFFENFATAVTMNVNGTTKQVAAGVEQGQRGGLFVFSLDGSGFRPLWPKVWSEGRPATAGYPTWSPDGKWIAFHEQYDRPGLYGYRIAKCRDDANDYMVLTDRDGSNAQPTWSPKGDSIAYTDFRVGEFQEPHLFLMRPDGTDKQDTKQWGRRPCWSPDGKMI